jgi:heme A synthase
VSAPGPAALRFAAFARFTLGYTVFVILFGAWVRITGSGAGCGQHWPTCHGEVVHRPQSIETAIELFHRVTSGLDGLLAVALVVAALRVFPRRHPCRGASVMALVFVLVEGAIGALLVKAELVADDDSVARAVVMSIHLVNTTLLTGAMTVAAWAASRRAPLRLADPARLRPWIVLAVAGVIATSTSGAITALGDTLYPVAPEAGVLEHVIEDASVTAHFLQRTRTLHPALAVAVALVLLHVAALVMDRRPDVAGRWPTALRMLVLAQVLVGIVDIAASAPGWLQLVHLGLAKLVWIALVLVALSASTAPTEMDARAEP